MLTPRSGTPTDDELIAHIRQWLDLLADGRVADACSMLDEANVYGQAWSPAAIFELVNDTFRPGTRFRAEHPSGPSFSHVLTAVGDGRPSVVALADNSGYSVEHDVPLNGAYSDLTAQFEFRWRDDALAFVLHDLHVL